MTVEHRIHQVEADLFESVGVEVEESFLDLVNTGVRVRCWAPAAVGHWSCSTA